ncbi:LacI family DNA-binding transcriptional regulator [Microbacterium capsulatum]|uniref:LacI family DNA-binding transcriptional regulator n=1 Tax=Microbacterium capsulatum TaxID=3041921 RepID=A0ABU0XCU6_9MICO|nr:LacI family DNA-binding transcriptional regulator [Microbacterium sp. ASV81]MDQ4212939.1 LacI family DNA-binding transcriptional regulator [Microbacterium sp. ASV81]
MQESESGRRVTLADVAELSGVHTATVSRALNPAARLKVAAETVRRVEAAAHALGYVPNVVARGLRKRASMTVGVVIPDLTNPFFPPVVRGIEDYLQVHGYTALLANTDEDDDAEEALVTSLLERRVDGLIMATGRHGDRPVLRRLQASGVRTVMVNRDASPLPFPLVTGDDALGIAAAVAHLHDLGHRDIVHIAGPLDLSTSLVRADAFTAAVRARRGIRGRVIEASALSVMAGSEIAPFLLADSPPTAVVASNDLLAIGVLRALKAQGRSCPEDLAIVGFNDMPFAEDLQPPLTTVHVPGQAMGTAAARLLLDALAGDAPGAGAVVLPTSLIVRGSTGPVRR